MVNALKLVLSRAGRMGISKAFKPDEGRVYHLGVEKQLMQLGASPFCRWEGWKMSVKRMGEGFTAKGKVNIDTVLERATSCFGTFATVVNIIVWHCGSDNMSRCRLHSATTDLSIFVDFCTVFTMFVWWSFSF